MTEASSKTATRIGIIGVGGMGSHHARYLRSGRVAGATLAAVCDINPARLAEFSDLPGYRDSAELIRSGLVDAVLIATPHYGHTTIGIDALEQGLHVLVEKPISVHKADAERLCAAHRDPRQVFSAMFNQRTTPAYIRLRQMIQRGDLGAIFRVNWIVTDWFRTEAYYASGGWRATWKGEGGGVLLNQCPHNLDMLIWLCGMPRRVRAFCGIAVRHQIEVEDNVTAYFEYDSGATGVFIASTCEAPGTNRLEIAGENGRVLVDNGKLLFTRNETPMTDFSRHATSGFAKPDVWNVDVPVSWDSPQHVGITQNFVNAIRDGAPLVAPAEEGLASVELANAMLFSSFEKRTVELPLDGAAYEQHLQRLIAQSDFRKGEVRERSEGMGASFQKP